MRARRQVVVMLATVIICFFICLLPFRLFTLFLLFVSAQTIDSIGMETYYVYLYTSRVMLYLNSALNPLLYNLISSKFRNAFVQILCCRSISGVNRMLVRQSTFNTTTTTMSLTGVSGLNGFLNHLGNSNCSDLNSPGNKYKRNSIQSLKQSRSIDTNLRQLSYRRNRQASLQQFSSTGSGQFSSNDLSKDENGNKIDANKIDANKIDANKSDAYKIDADKQLIKQTSFMQSELDPDCIDQATGESSTKDIDQNSNVNKKQCTVNCELKVSTLQQDVKHREEERHLNSLDLDGRKENKKFNFKFYKQITNRLFAINRPTSRPAATLNNETNTLIKESIIEEESNRHTNNESSKESNV